MGAFSSCGLVVDEWVVVVAGWVEDWDVWVVKGVKWVVEVL